MHRQTGTNFLTFKLTLADIITVMDDPNYLPTPPPSSDSDEWSTTAQHGSFSSPDPPSSTEREEL